MERCLGISRKGQYERWGNSGHLILATCLLITLELVVNSTTESGYLQEP